MSPDLDKKLCEDFPELFANRNGDMRTTCMVWGFEHGDGWEKIIRECAEQLTYLSKVTGAKFTASQVKEKFGTLRFYFDMEIPDGAEQAPIWDIAHAVVGQAEGKSAYTCETCGEYGRMRGNGWLYTACDAHTKEADREP